VGGAYGAAAMVATEAAAAGANNTSATQALGQVYARNICSGRMCPAEAKEMGRGNTGLTGPIQGMGNLVHPANR